MATQNSKDTKARRSLVREVIGGAGARLDANARRELQSGLDRETRRRLGNLAGTEDGQEYLRAKRNNRTVSLSNIDAELRRRARKIDTQSSEREWSASKAKREREFELRSLAQDKAKQVGLTEATQDAAFTEYATAKKAGHYIEWKARLGARPSHAALDGERIQAGETFSNGLRFPGDPSGPANETINCHCTIRRSEG